MKQFIGWSTLAILGSFYQPARSDNESTSLPHARRRYDYKQSLKKPYRIHDVVPGFSTYEGAIVTDHYIRLSSSIPGSRGSLWASEPNPYNEWEVELSFQVSGRGTHGRDGVAFWYAQDRGESGTVLGSRDEWVGLAVLHDTYDKVADAVSPYILGIINDGTKQVGNSTNILTQMFGGCYRDFRNSAVPVHTRITYAESTLKVAVDTAQNGKSYINCFESKDIDLPTGYYFGMSASSAYPAVYEINPPVPDHDMERPYEKEIMEKEGKIVLTEESKKKLDRLRSEIKKGLLTNDDEEDFDSENPPPSYREHAVEETQFRIIESLNRLHKKLEEVEAKLGIATPAAVTSSSGTLSTGKLESEVQTLMNKVDTLAASLRDTKDQLHNVQSSLQSSHQVGKTELISVQAALSSLTSRLDQLMNHGLTERASVGSKLDTVTFYLWYLFLMALLGGALVIGYAIYRTRSNKVEKKYI